MPTRQFDISNGKLFASLPNLSTRVNNKYPSATEIVSERRENGKLFTSGNNKYINVITQGIVHYKEDYNNPLEEWKEADLTPVENGDHYLIDKSSTIIKVYKNKVGYEFTSRRSGHKVTVELITPKPALADVDFEFNIYPTKIRLWKNVKHSGAIKKLRWKKTEENIASGLHSLKFRENPEAFDSDGNKAEIVTTKIPIDKNTCYWDEEFTGVCNELSEDGNVIGEQKTPVYPVKIDVDVDEDVGASGDCAYFITGGSYWSQPSDRYNAGTYSAGSYEGYGSPARWQTVNIPNSATIDTADISAFCSTNFTGTDVQTKIDALAEDDPSDFSGDDYSSFMARSRTTAKVDWDITASWSVGTEYTSPELKTIFQELVNRGGWSANNDMATVWYDDGSGTSQDLRRCAHYGHGTYDPPSLHIEYTAVSDVNINQTKISVEATPKTHSVAIDTVINQTTENIEATPKTHNIAIDEIINQVTKSVEVTPKTHSVLIDEAISQTKQAVQASPKSHTILLDQAISQTKQTVDVTPKSHSVAIDLLIPQTKQSVDVTPKSHSISIDEAIVQTKQSVDVTAKTHAIAIDEIVNHVKQTIEATAKTHVVLLDIAISQTKQAIEASPKTHTIAIDEIINQVTKNIEVTGKTHTVMIAEIVQQVKQAIEADPKTHGIAIDEIVNQVKKTIEATPKTHGIAIDQMITQSKKAVEVTPKTHTVLIDVAHSQTKQSVDVTAKSHKIAIDLLINQIKQAIEATPKTHSVLIDEAVSQVKQRIEADPKTHTIQITADVIINQSKQAVEVTAKTHSILIDEAISQIKQAIEATPKSHSITIDEAISQTKQAIEVTPKSHTIRLDEAISQTKQTIDVTPKSHSVAIDELINQIKQSIEITPKTHAIAIDTIINQVAKSVDVTAKSHLIQIDEIISQIKTAIAATAKTHRVAIDEIINQTKQSIEATPKVHTIVTTPDIEIQQVLKHIIATGKSHTVLIVGGFVIIIGKGLMTMDRKVIFDFDYPQQILPVIELNENATAHGDIELKIDDLEEITSITSVIYSCNPPSSTNDNWQGVGNDIYSSSILNVTSTRMSSGRYKLHYIFDPSGIVGIGDGQFYAVIIKVNDADDATIPQAGVEMIFKINNNIAVPA